MELQELQKMISIIHDKKTKCKGNLRVKVLLKSTHDYVRRSLIDDQLGKSEKLMTLLRNSGTVKEPICPANTVHETMNVYQIFTLDTISMECDEIFQHTTTVGNDQGLQCSEGSHQNLQHVSENISSTNEVSAQRKDDCNLIRFDIPKQFISKCGHVFNCNKSYDGNNYKLKDKYSDVIQAFRKLLKYYKVVMSKAKNNKSRPKHYRHRVKRMRKLLLESKVGFKADYEEYVSKQIIFKQRIVLIYLKTIKKMIKQCDKFLENKNNL